MARALQSPASYTLSIVLGFTQLLVVGFLAYGWARSTDPIPWMPWVYGACALAWVSLIVLAVVKRRQAVRETPPPSEIRQRRVADVHLSRD